MGPLGKPPASSALLPLPEPVAARAVALALSEPQRTPTSFTVTHANNPTLLNIPQPQLPAAGTHTEPDKDISGFLFHQSEHCAGEREPGHQVDGSSGREQ
jgi:hypothetical protein